MIMKVLVIIPAYNEAEAIEDTVRAVRDKAPGCDLLVVNDGSTDQTLQILQRRGINHLNLRCNLGIGGCVQSGFLYAWENGYDYAVQIDGDGQHDPAYILPIVEQMEKDGVDLGIGSRYVTKEGFQSSAARRMGISFLSKLIYAVCHTRVKDVTSGYRVSNKRMLAYFAGHYSDDYPEPDAIVMAVTNGYRVGEYPVVMRERATGVSSISAFKSVYYMIKVSLSIIMCKTVLKGK